jgi:hypothetical protein
MANLHTTPQEQGLRCNRQQHGSFSNLQAVHKGQERTAGQTPATIEVCGNKYPVKGNILVGAK